MARPSHVRDAVEELIVASERHDWSTEEVLAALVDRDVPANASSVFRALSRLEADGVVCRVDLGDGRARYEGAGDHHEHVRCEICGTVAAIPGCAIGDVRPAIERSTGFRLTGHQLLFSGLCPACTPAQRQERA